MNTYKFVYSQPYERDYDSPAGIGDHCIEYGKGSITFQADDNEDAKEAVRRFLEEGSVVFSHYLDGDGKAYLRKFISLTKIEEILL